MTNDNARAASVTLVVNGEYVEGSNLASKVLSYKTGVTTGNRVEISLPSQLGNVGGETFGNIKSLMNAQGNGSDTTLY